MFQKLKGVSDTNDCVINHFTCQAIHNLLFLNYMIELLADKPLKIIFDI